MTHRSPKRAPIRILAPPKEIGDLFTRRVSDLFQAQGYDPPSLNLHKTGREIDIRADHHLEFRRVVAECKATGKPIGGNDLNKFFGVLDGERQDSSPRETVGYFISLSGFTEPGREQERAFPTPRMTLLDGLGLVEALVRSRVIRAPEEAVNRARRCASRSGSNVYPEGPPQLLAHESGWIWAVFFRRNVEVTHLALIHADGDTLSLNLAREILEADRQAQGDLHRLDYLQPEVPEEEALRLENARQRYFACLATECGELELDCLPTDQEIGFRRRRLEDLLVPHHFEPIRTIDAIEKRAAEVGENGGKPAHLPVGEALAKRSRLLVLAQPGGGKTTLLKWLAVAYAFPERRIATGNCLPDRDWFPLLLRCRQIEDRANEPITTLLARLGERCEMVGEHGNAFQSLLHSALHEGKALLLIDGLDEIADDGHRLSFVSQLRTFLSTYPGVDVVVTVREAGFRAVAGVLSAHCDQYRISDFDRNDIEQFTMAWHSAAMEDQQQAEARARFLAASIWGTDSLRRLAVNPLLLMTLLQVQSRGGQLLPQCSILYEKAIEMLIESWNIEGFDPLDVQEVTAQLAFLAWQMKEEGTLRISQPRLHKTLQAARSQMPEALAHARLNPAKFIERVERRSGLLVESGRETENGRSVLIYEFRHSMFQDYLAAKALVEGYCPGGKTGATLVSKLEPHLEDEAWKEVIPLVAVLSGSEAKPLIEFLVEQIAYVKKTGVDSCAVSLLIQCLVEGVQVSPDLAMIAFDAIARVQPGKLDFQLVHRLVGSQYGETFRDVIWNGFTGSTTDLPALSSVLMAIGWIELEWPLKPGLTSDRIRQAEALLLHRDPQKRALGLLIVSWFACQLVLKPEEDPPQEQVSTIAHLVPHAIAALESALLWEQFSGVLSLGWLARAGAVPAGDDAATVQRLLDLWLSSEALDLREKAGWALVGVPLVPRLDSTFRTPTGEYINRVLEIVHEKPHSDGADHCAALLAAFYWRQPWSDDELSRILAETITNSPTQDQHEGRVLRYLLSQLKEGRQAEVT